MPSSGTILCQIRSKGQDGGFVSGLANYMIEPGKSKPFHYGFYKKQISLFLYDLQVSDYALLCGKYVFNRGIMYMLVHAAFQIPSPENHENSLIPTGPYASFVGKINETVEPKGDDCKFGINLTEYNNFSFGNKEKMDFQIQVVYDASPKSRFKNLASRLNIGKSVFISGFFDLDENTTPFIIASEIDLLEDFSTNLSSSQLDVSSQSPFSRANKFKNNKTVTQKLWANNTKTIENKNDKQMQDIVNIKNEDDSVVVPASTSETVDKQKKNNKRKRELADLSVEQLKKAARRTKIRTRSQKEEEPSQIDNIVLTEAEEE